MILEIESYKKDTLLSGKSVSFSELKKQLETTENIHDTETDYIYDRDVRKIIKK